MNNTNIQIINRIFLACWILLILLLLFIIIFKISHKIAVKNYKTFINRYKAIFVGMSEKEAFKMAGLGDSTIKRIYEQLNSPATPESYRQEHEFAWQFLPGNLEQWLYPSHRATAKITIKDGKVFSKVIEDHFGRLVEGEKNE